MKVNNNKYAAFKANEIERALNVIDAENSVKINLPEIAGEINIHEFDEEVEQSLSDNSYAILGNREQYEYFLNEVIEYDCSDLNKEDCLYINQEEFIDELVEYGFGFNKKVALINEKYYAIFTDNESNGKVAYTNKKNAFIRQLNQLMDNYWLEVLDTLRERNQEEKDFVES